MASVEWLGSTAAAAECPTVYVSMKIKMHNPISLRASLDSSRAAISIGADARATKSQLSRANGTQKRICYPSLSAIRRGRSQTQSHSHSQTHRFASLRGASAGPLRDRRLMHLINKHGAVDSDKLNIFPIDSTILRIRRTDAAALLAIDIRSNLMAVGSIYAEHSDFN